MGLIKIGAELEMRLRLSWLDRPANELFNSIKATVLADLPEGRKLLAHMTYIHEGKQYIVLAVSGNGPTDIIALALPD